MLVYQASDTLEVVPGGLTYTVTSVNGTVYFNGSAGAGTPINGTHVNVGYNDNGDNRVSGNDSISMQLVPITSILLDGGALRVFYNSSQIGVAEPLPTTHI